MKDSLPMTERGNSVSFEERLALLEDRTKPKKKTALDHVKDWAGVATALIALLYTIPLGVWDYWIKTPENTYYAKIYHQYPTVDKIYIGGDQWCVDISIYLDGDENPNIDGIGYDKKCNVTLDFKRGDGTKHMIFCAFAFIKVIYKTFIRYICSRIHQR